MLIAIKFVSSMILSIGGALAISNIENTKIKFGMRQTIFIMILSIGTFVFSGVQYKPYQSILMLIIMILAYKEIFNLSVSKAVVLTVIVMILASLGDIVALLITMNFVDVATYHTSPVMLILGNLSIALFLYVLTKFRIISSKINYIVNKVSQNKALSIIIEIFLAFALVVLLMRNFIETFAFEFDYFVNLFIYILVGLMLTIFIKENDNYEKLLKEYDALIEYVQTFEEWIEEEQLELHESKNSLSAIYEMTNIKEVKKEIDKILNRKGSVEDQWVTDLKPIPKGGLKGLLYYKFMIAKNSKVRIITDVSNKVTNKFKKLEKADFKLLLRLIGIYFDNAIEAAEKSKQKNISFEVYILKNELNVVITNTYEGYIDLNKIGKKGVSTKGEKRGKGVYLANKLVSKNKKFETENSVLNNYYIQRIRIK